MAYPPMALMRFLCSTLVELKNILIPLEGNTLENKKNLILSLWLSLLISLYLQNFWIC